MDGNRVIELLESIDRRLALLAATDERALRHRLESEVLRSPGRIAMWDAIDGQRGSPAIAAAGGVTPRFAQMFVNELREARFVCEVPDAGPGLIVQKDHAAILDWYLRPTPDPAK